jgi:putative flippase GtrA
MPDDSNVDLTFVKYCVVGTFVTLVDFVVFSIAFYDLSLSASLSKFLAFCTAVAVSYILNRIWTFRSRDPRIFLPMARFGVVASVGALLSVGLIVLLVHPLSIHPLVANALTSCAVLTWNFLGNKYWTFGDSHGRRTSPVIDFRRGRLRFHSIRP